MKKIFLVSILATFVSVFCASAQDNTYSIIIKMANGTTFTIGPNEVDSISFDYGQMTVSGSRISDLEASIKDLWAGMDETKMYVDKTAMELDETRARTEQNTQLIMDTREYVQAVDATTAKQQAQINALEAKCAYLQSMVDSLDTKCIWLTTIVKELYDHLGIPISSDLGN